jgi:hypothetical protein
MSILVRVLAAAGVKTQDLFPLFDDRGTVVASNPEIESLERLEGRTLAADTATTDDGGARKCSTR